MEKSMKCKHNYKPYMRENSIYCKKEEGYVSPKRCLFCKYYEEEGNK